MEKAIIYTLGCRLNQSESSVIAKQLEDAGYMIVKNGPDINLCLINTCTVTQKSDQKCQQLIKTAQKKYPQAIIVVMGCFPQVSQEKIQALEGVHIILGNTTKLNILYYLQQFKKNQTPIIDTSAPQTLNFTIPSDQQARTTTRSNLKIQDGCNFFCSYCIIPFARGRSRARDFNNCFEAAIELVNQGAKEIILTGINLGTYQDQSHRLLHVIEKLNTIKGLKRIRISSVEPTTIGAEIFQLMNDHTCKLVPHLHFPLQSLDNQILKAMGRRYLFEEYATFIQQAFDEVKDLCLGTDLLIGFPGENEQIFQQSLIKLKKLPLHYFHVFPFSERKGTRAVNLPNKVSPIDIQQRTKILRNLSKEKHDKFLKTYLNKTVEVLFENQKNAYWQGYSPNYIKVKMVAPQNLHNQVINVKIGDIESDSSLIGKRI